MEEFDQDKFIEAYLKELEKAGYIQKKDKPTAKKESEKRNE